MTDEAWDKLRERLGNALAHHPEKVRAAVEAMPATPRRSFRAAMRAAEKARLQAAVDAQAAEVAALAAEPDE